MIVSLKLDLHKGHFIKGIAQRDCADAAAFRKALMANLNVESAGLTTSPNLERAAQKMLEC